MSYEDALVWEKCINGKVVPEICFVALLQLKAPVRTISVESTLALNPWCFHARVVYVHTPGAHTLPSARPSMIHWVFSPNWKKVKKLRVITLHMSNYCPTFRACTPLMQVPYVPQSLPRALRNIRHLHEWGTSSEVGAVSHSEIKCCKKHTHTQDQPLINL